MKEIELKLQLAHSSDAIRFKTLTILQTLPHTQSEISTIYFDTSNLVLKKNRYAFRIRKQNGHIIQTIKHSPHEESALQQRDEWENNNTEVKPQLDRIENTDIKLKLAELAIDNQSLTPLFETRFHRDMWIYHPNSEVEIEIALDCGHILCQNNALPILEIELELKKGHDENSLYQIAALFSRDIELIPATQSKAARGYALLAQHTH